MTFSSQFRPAAQVKKLYDTAIIPSYQTDGAIGADLHLHDPSGTTTEISSKVRIFKTGLAIVAPPGFYIRIAPRSGLGSRGVHVLGGVVDPDYRDELGVILVLAPDHPPIPVSHGDRIAQLVFERAEQVTFEETRDLSPTRRGSGGFGSTGMPGK